MQSGSNEQYMVPLKPTELVSGSLADIESIDREIRTRRKLWLEQNPDHLDSLSINLQLTDPLAYDDLIRQHQTIAEREAEGRKRGLAGTLEASLLRSEARLAKADPSNPKYQETVRSPIPSIDATHAQRKGPLIDWTIDNSDSEDALDDEKETIKYDGGDSQVKITGNTKTSLRLRRIGQEKWRNLIAQRFIDGCDNDFDYAAVDLNLSIDEDWAREQSEENWFEKEDDHLEGHEGETGVQDF